MTEIVRVKNISKTFSDVDAVTQVNFTIKEGEMVALIGPSGSGKSTLLRLINGLEQSDPAPESYIEVLSETVQYNGNVNKRIRVLRKKISMIFQQFNLVGTLPVMTNVLTGALGRTPLYRSLFGLYKKDEQKQAVKCLYRVGLADKVWQRSSTLSGGQQQRVAIARALMQETPLILADEPISSLDPESSQNIMEILRHINQEDKKTILVCLHQIEYALKYCDRVIVMREGSILKDCKTRDVDQQYLRALYKKQDQDQ